MRKLIVSVFYILYFSVSTFANAATCPSLEGVYSTGEKRVCLHGNTKDYSCVELIIVTQNDCNNYSVFEKDYITNWDNSVNEASGSRDDRRMRFLNLVAGDSDIIGINGGDYPVLTKKLRQVGLQYYLTQYVTPSALIVYSLVGNTFSQTQVRVADNRLIVEKRSSHGVINNDGHQSPGPWSNWHQVLNIPKVNEMSNKLPESIWNTNGETGFYPNPRIDLTILFKNGEWNVIAPRNGNFTPIPLKNWKSLNINNVKATLANLDRSKKFSCSFKAHRLTVNASGTDYTLENSLYVESLANCLEL